LRHHKLEPTFIEVTVHCYESLAECIGDFDLVLSCIGIEYNHGVFGEVYIHPEVESCVSAQEVRVVHGLDSMLYRLGSLERLRRYAEELKFTVSESSVTQLWKLFFEQSREKQDAMLNAVGLSRSDVPTVCRSRAD